jgi:hypothetical protein
MSDAPSPSKMANHLENGSEWEDTRTTQNRSATTKWVAVFSSNPKLRAMVIFRLEMVSARPRTNSARSSSGISGKLRTAVRDRLFLQSADMRVCWV